MINIILILLIIILFFIINVENFSIINFNDDTYKDNSLNISQNNKLKNDFNIENEFNCYLYGCTSSRNDMIDWIGVDNNNNQIFTDNTDFFIFNNGFLDKIDNINKNKIKSNDNIISIPVINEDDKLKLKLNLKYKDSNFIGYLTNNYYHIQYLLYEKAVNTEINNTKLYEYIVIKIIKNKYQIIYKLPLRSKIENTEQIWITYGSLNLGPLIFTTKIN